MRDGEVDEGDLCVPQRARMQKFGSVKERRPKEVKGCVNWLNPMAYPILACPVLVVASQPRSYLESCTTIFTSSVYPSTLTNRLVID